MDTLELYFLLAAFRLRVLGGVDFLLLFLATIFFSFVFEDTFPVMSGPAGLYPNTSFQIGTADADGRPTKSTLAVIRYEKTDICSTLPFGFITADVEDLFNSARLAIGLKVLRMQGGINFLNFRFSLHR